MDLAGRARTGRRGVVGARLAEWRRLSNSDASGELGGSPAGGEPRGSAALGELGAQAARRRGAGRREPARAGACRPRLRQHPAGARRGGHCSRRAAFGQPRAVLRGGRGRAQRRADGGTPARQAGAGTAARRGGEGTAARRGGRRTRALGGGEASETAADARPRTYRLAAARRGLGGSHASVAAGA